MTLKKYLLDDILGLESHFRRNFMNSVEGFKNAALIGTCDSRRQTNLAIFNSIVHIGATPPLIGFIHRPVTVPKQTFTNIQVTNSFTINLVHREILEQAHQTSARYAPGVSEFSETGLTAEFSEVVDAPYVREAMIKFGLTLEEILPVRTNGTYLIIGRVEELFVPDEAVGDDGFVDLTASGTIACAGLDTYYDPRPITRLAYAKPDLPVRTYEQ